MTDELRPAPAEMNGNTADAQTAGTTGAPAAEPERTMVMNTDSVDRTLVMNTDSVDRTMVMSDDSPDRTIVLSAENGITRVDPEDTQTTTGGRQRTRLQSILHNSTSIFSALGQARASVTSARRSMKWTAVANALKSGIRARSRRI